jgi:hypothetical protein
MMTEQKLDSIGWGLFFIWIGVALFLGFQLQTSLVGIGVIILGMQIVRKYFKFKFEMFYVIAGICLIIFNLLKISDINIPIIPIALIVIGCFFIFTSIKKK